MIARRSAGLVRRWVGFYTRGLSAEVRDGRREEIESHLWDQLEEATSTGRSDRSIGADILMRLVLGLPADLSWRTTRTANRQARPATEGTAATGTRVVGLLAIVGGLGVAIGASVFAGVILAKSTMRPWEQGVDPLQESIMAVAGSVGIVAIAAATAGLVLRFRHRAGNAAVAAALIAAVGAVLGVLVVWPAIYLALPGFAYLVWELGRAGVLGRRVVSANLLSTVLLLVPIAAMFTGTTVGLAIALVVPYPVTWLAIGGSLLRGASGTPPAVQGA
jgi:hypothetical protein